MGIGRTQDIVAVVSLLMVPALSANAIESCTCKDEICHSPYKMNCCTNSVNSCCLSYVCFCMSQKMQPSSLLLYDPCSPFFGKSSQRQYASKNISTGRACSAKTSSCSVTPLSNYSTMRPPPVGPPDMDVVEYLPPSAKQVFHVLASDGPLTQKDIINKTDLPPRTIRYALSRLKDEHMLEERFCFKDARQSLTV